ncbi:hypothetical protein PV327_001016 [Microctonus hyperodae]|uniref:tRNA pseudouridine(55) synthase n=1 Tax=Microctonus hyperodae TaxID=165561 RepID=A0AA39L2R8_MICHY|nr:hypothetical protein PV327_001016 [Microctonus hyperodae]
MDCTIIPETQHQMFEYLKSINCCLSCCTRFIGTESSEYFRNLMSDSKLLNDTLKDANASDNVPCIVCLGILQHDIQQQTLKQIIDSVNSSGFDSPTFTCNLSIPASLNLRERYIYISLTQKFNLSKDQLCYLKLRTQNIKEVWKMQMLSAVEAGILKQQISGAIPSLFSIDITYDHANDQEDCQKFTESYIKNVESKNSKHRNNIYSRNNIEKLLNNIEDDEFMKYFSLSSGHVTIGKISCFHRGIFIGGRYKKLSRHLSQTPWYINGEKKMETSVQDLLCNHIVKYTNSDTLKFLSSGREDVDVRTINRGRPFAVELINPKVTIITAEKLAEIVNEINASTKLVEITSGLKFLCSGDLQKLKEGENIKTKCYRALCILRHKSKDDINLEQLSNMKNIKIIQKTPIRVLHRRPLTPRTRLLREMRARWLTIEEIKTARELFSESRIDHNLLNHLFVFDIKTQAGTYVKEFVHGDFGRTRPNLSDILGAEVDIVALDVTAVNIEWP